MQAIVTPEEMAAIDKAAPESLEVLIERAGRAVMNHALKMLGGAKHCAGKSILIIFGKGNNGADGKCAGELLADRGFAVKLLSVKEADKLSPEEIFSRADLVIDAAFGTGLQRAYLAPDFSNIPSENLPSVLAVDIPSGVDGLTGEIEGRALKADRTITFGALKPGHLLPPGSIASGEVFVDSIGLDVSSGTSNGSSNSRAWLLDDESVRADLPKRSATAHKWQSACWLIGGSEGMAGAVSLMAMGAYRAGAGYVRVSSIGGEIEIGEPIEAVGTTLQVDEKTGAGWSKQILKAADRFGALAFGPGLNIDASDSNINSGELKNLLAELQKPLLIDGGGLNLLAEIGPQVLQSRKAPTILTPHDKEFERLNGSPPLSDRFKSVRELAKKYNSIVLLKGATTLVANPAGQVLASNTGDERLATAGTGDVLTGIITALLAQGINQDENKSVDLGKLVAMGAYIHGKAAQLGPKVGLIASDIAGLIPQALTELQKSQA